MPVTLINKQNRMRVFNLDHPSFDSEARHMTVHVVEEGRDGGRYPRRVRKRVCGSLTLLAKEKKHNLPDQVIKVPQVAKAIDDGTLSYLVVKIEPKKSAMTKATTETESKTTKTVTETKGRSKRKS